MLFNVVTLKKKAILLCSRGAGKTESTAAAMYLEALNGGFAVALSRSDRQAMKLVRYVLRYHYRLSKIVGVEAAKKPTAHELQLANGGGVLALPCSEETIRGEHGVTLLVIDEAARVPDAFYGSVTPMISTVNGRIVLLSTPWGKRGFFYREWFGKGDTDWEKYRNDWTKCPRITREFIEAERRRHGNDWVKQEYEVEFLDAISSTFKVEDFENIGSNGGYERTEIEIPETDDGDESWIEGFLRE